MSTERCPTCDAPVAEMRSRLRDEEMIAAGWLPPDEAERLKAARDNLLRSAEILADEVVHANALVAAMQPVIEAVRALIVADLRVRWEAFVKLKAAMEALDAAVSPPEGLKQ